MHRRQFLALTGATLSTTAAGCSFLGGGTGEGTPTETLSTPERHVAAFRSSLASADRDLASAELDGDILVAEYPSDAATEDDVLEEVEDFAVAFLEALAAGMDAAWLEAWLLDGEGEERAVYTIHESWAREWDEGERSDDEFFGRVADTISWQ